jgi:hypothetical protein
MSSDQTLIDPAADPDQTTLPASGSRSADDTNANCKQTLPGDGSAQDGANQTALPGGSTNPIILPSGGSTDPPPPPRPDGWPAGFPWPWPPTQQPVIIMQAPSHAPNPPRPPKDPLFERFKFDVHKLPTLGTDLDFPNWRLRLMAALEGLGLLPMLDDAKFQPERWPRLKTWILQSLTPADWHVGFHCTSLKQIVNDLKHVHSSRDSTNAKQIIAEILI